MVESENLGLPVVILIDRDPDVSLIAYGNSGWTVQCDGYLLSHRGEWVPMQEIESSDDWLPLLFTDKASAIQAYEE